MTSENPETRAGKCKACKQRISIKKNDMGSLIAKCGCEITRPIKVSQATPTSWSL